MGELKDENARLRAELAEARAQLDRKNRELLVMGLGSSGSRVTLLEAMLETVPVGVVLADASGRIVHGNSWVEKNLRHPVRHSADTQSYGEWVSFHADGRQVESHEYPLSRVISDGVEHSELEVHYQRGDGTLFWMRIIGQPVRDKDGKTIGAAVALVDIDDEARLIEEKEVLLGEVNHRVKNSLQLVSSILSLQARSADPASAGLLKAAAIRVQAISSVHAALYQDRDVGAVEFSGYLRQTCERIALAHGADERGIAIVVEAEKLYLGADKAIPLSLVVNELITNAFKYAFSDDGAEGAPLPSTPEIRVCLGRNSSGTAYVEVQDNGDGDGTNSATEAYGSGDASVSAEGHGLGSKLVTILARQLNAEIKVNKTRGWAVRLEFETE